MFVCSECCVLSGRGLCDELITRPEVSYRLWCVVVCDLEKKLVKEEAKAHWGLSRQEREKYIYIYIYIYIYNVDYSSRLHTARITDTQNICCHMKTMQFLEIF